MPHDTSDLSDDNRRFGDMPTNLMNDDQRATNDWLLNYMYPEQSSARTTIGGPIAALLHSPRLAEGIGRMVPVMFDELSIPRAVVEIAILVTARHWNCHYEFDTHRRYAARSGVDPSVVLAIETGSTPTLDDEMREAFDFARELLRQGDVSDRTFARVAGHWGLQGAVELIATVGFYSMLALVLNVDHYPVPRDRKLPTIL